MYFNSFVSFFSFFIVLFGIFIHGNCIRREFIVEYSYFCALMQNVIEWLHTLPLHVNFYV